MPQSIEIESVAGALSRLRQAADRAAAGWLPTSWTKVAGPGPDRYGMKEIRVLGPIGAFDGPLALEPDGTLTIECDLDVPAEILGVPTAGEPLEVTVWSLFPMSLHHHAADGTVRSLLDEEIPPAASGPVLLTVVPSLSGSDGPGGNGRLRCEVRTFDNQVYRPWNWFSFTTPGLRARFEAVDVAWAQLFLADTMASSAEERKAVEAAALCAPDVSVLESKDNAAALSVALDEVASALAPVAQRIESLPLHLVGHSHIDMNWLWTWPDTVEVIRRDFRSIVSLLDDYPEMHFTHSQPATYRVIQEREPELFARVKAHIAAGRWEPATMQWVEGDTNMASSEATARQLAEAVTYTREHLGAEPRVFLAPDTFGHAGNLPQVAASGGTRVYYHHRCNPGTRFGTPWPAYWWEGQDGTRVLGVTTPSYNGHITAGAVAQAAVQAWSNGLPAGLMFYGVGDHGGGPTRESLDALRRLQTKSGLPALACSTISSFADEVIASGVSLPIHRGESSTTFEGCYTTHGDAKRFNREGENLLQSAEALGALAGTDARAPLADAWRTVLFNQFHDIFDGSAIAEVYRDQAVDHEAVVAAANAAIDDALGVLHANVGVDEGVIAVTNPLAWERTEPVFVAGAPQLGGAVDAADMHVVVEGDDGTVLRGQVADGGLWFVPTVAGFSTRSFTVRPATDRETAPPLVASLLPTDAGDEAKSISVETPFFRISIGRASGVIRSLVDRRTGRELVPNGPVDFRPELAFGALQLLDELPHGMSSWDMREVARETTLLTGATTSVVESGPVRLVVEVRHSVRASMIVERIAFYNDVARIDFEVEIDWQEPGNSEVGVPDLKVSFNARTRRPQAWFETPFGAVERAADGMEVPALRWAAIVGEDGGFAVLNDCKYGYDALGTRLRLTLVRTAYDPDAASDIGSHRMGFSLVPLVGDWREADVTRQAAGFNQRLIARLASPATTGSLLGAWQPKVPSGPIVVSGLKVARVGRGRIVRLYESTGRPATTEVAGVPEGAEVWEVTVVEDRVARLPVDAGRVHLAFRPWQVRTLLVEEP